MPNELRYFSTFTGVGGFELGIGDRAKCVGFSEIDAYCSRLLTNKWPNIRNYGDITKINTEELPDFDLFVGGFPCQSFSIAGKRRGFEDTRGTMFFEISRILKVKRPKFVLLENVKGLLNHDKGQTFSVIIQTLEELGYRTQWMVLNSKFFGVPQNRERVFIIGSLRGESRPEILPFRENDSKINEQRNTSRLEQTAQALRARDYTNWNGNIRCLSGGGHSGGLHSDMTFLSQAFRVRNTDGVSSTLQGQAGGVGAKTGLYAIPVLTPDRVDKRQNGRRFKEDGEESFTLTKTDIHGVSDGFKIRRLTPTECERLQGFPDGWTKDFSDTQRYKMMGNAVTVNVIKAIIDRWFNEI